MSIKFRILNSIILILLSSFTQSTTFQGKVVRVIDGDTIVVLDSKNEQIKVRLEGIDCPESKQDFGTQAKNTTSALCFGKTVRVVQSGIDRYDRVLGYVYVDDICVNEELLRQGMAWHYKRYNNNTELAQLEVTARKLKIGLWIMKTPVEPWKWREFVE